MARKSKKTKILNPQDLVTKLNTQIHGGNAKVLDAKEISDGVYQLEVQIPETNLDELLKQAKNSVKAQVTPLTRSPLIEGIKKNQEVEALHGRLQEARARGAEKMMQRLEREGKNPDEVEKELARLDIRYRDILGGSYLDLRDKGAEETEALKLYKRSSDEYYKTGIYGTHLDMLSNFAATGFYNEINNPEIKEFYDSWAKDTKFVDLVGKIFHNLFKYSVCYVLRATGPYEPHSDGISSVPGKEPNGSTKSGKKARMAHLIASKIRDEMPGMVLDYEEFSKRYSREYSATGGYPIAYTLLDPQYVKMDGPGFFGATTISITSKGLSGLKKTLEKIKNDPSKVSSEVKEGLKMLPSAMKNAALEGGDYVFKEGEVSVIFLRKMDSEVYAKPRGARAFDAFDYRDELKKADFATVDGIYNYILKVTVGDKDFPVKDQQVLADLAEALNTPQKAFALVWNHTLKIEKITANEAGNILGKQKYEPVDDEISSALGFAKALIDGSGLSGDGALLITKGLQSEINAARIKVTDWVYSQYREIAISAGFSTYPVVRWKESVINTDSDSVTKASYMQMLDRKAISVQSYMREMGFDYDTEVQRMTEELPLVQDDILRAGSPYQAQVESAPVSGDSGRPKGQPTGPKKPNNPTKSVKDKTKVKTPSQASDDSEEWMDSLISALKGLDLESRTKLISSLGKLSSKEASDEKPAADGTIENNEGQELASIPVKKLLD